MIYLCGNISDNPDFKTDFLEAHKRLYKLGYRVINPIELCSSIDKNYPDANREKDYFKECLNALINPIISGIFFVNQADSLGCRAERLVAEKLGIKEVVL